MKRLVMIVGLVVGVVGLAEARQDRFGSMQIPVWRSSTTAVESGIVNIATGAVHFHGLSVNLLVGGSVYIYNSTGTALNLSTGPVIQTTRECSPCEFDIYLSSGFSVQKIGMAGVTYLWDWIGSPPRDIKRD